MKIEKNLMANRIFHLTKTPDEAKRLGSREPHDGSEEVSRPQNSSRTEAQSHVKASLLANTLIKQGDSHPEVQRTFKNHALSSKSRVLGSPQINLSTSTVPNQRGEDIAMHLEDKRMSKNTQGRPNFSHLSEMQSVQQLT